MTTSTLAPRMLELLEKAANAFIRNTNPFDVEWLTQYEVSLQECVDLSELIGKILEEYVLDQKEKEGGESS
jgi:hypothetical protein